MIRAIFVVESSEYFSKVFVILSVKLILSSEFSIKILSISSFEIFTLFKIVFNSLTWPIFVELAFLNSNRDIAISGAVEEFVIVIVELPFIARDPVAFILNLYGFTEFLCFVYNTDLPAPSSAL